VAGESQQRRCRRRPGESDTALVRGINFAPDSQDHDVDDMGGAGSEFIPDSEEDSDNDDLYSTTPTRCSSCQTHLLA
jgi:hypothetical protein